MACSCGSSRKRTYFALIALHSEVKGGLLGGSAPPLGSVKEVIVCSECGMAEYQIPAEEMRWFP